MGMDVDFKYGTKYKNVKEELDVIFIKRRFIKNKNFRKYLVETIDKYKENANDSVLIEYVKNLLSSNSPTSYVGGEILFAETDLFDESYLEKITKEALIKYLISILETKIKQ